MSLYTLALFLHVSGAIGAFISLGVWLFGLAALQRARRVEQVRTLSWLIVIVDPLMVLSVLLIGVAGFFLALSTWGLETSWIAVALVSFVLIAPVGPFVLSARMHAIRDLAATMSDGPLSEPLAKRTRDPLLVTAASTVAAVLLGIVFLMTNKPSLAFSILVMGVASILGLVSSLPFWYTTRKVTQNGIVHGDDSEADPFLRKSLWTRRW